MALAIIQRQDGITSRTRAKSRADGGNALSRVRVWPLGMAREERAGLGEVLRAFGGQLARQKTEVTHAILADCSPQHELPREVVEDVRYFLGVRKHIVSAQWLEFILRRPGSNAFDEQVLARFIPSGIQSLQATKRRRLCRKTATSLVHDHDELEGDPATSSSSSASAPQGHAASAPPAASAVTAIAEAEPKRKVARDGLAGSLMETLQFMRKEHPDEVEAGHLRIAIERSLLDCALVLQSFTPAGASDEHSASSETPEEVLGVAGDAGPADIRAAYRKKAKAAHPDRGGDSASFCRIRRAYLALLHPDDAQRLEEADTGQGAAVVLPALCAPTAAAEDFSLRDHRALVAECFARHGADLSAHMAQQQAALAKLGLVECEAGSVNTNEKGEEMTNQCFYLSLARAYTGGPRPRRREVEAVALVLKRVIEAAVLAAHPLWSGARVGEDVQAFSDFLVFSLGSNTLVAELCVAVFDFESGFVEIFKGKRYLGSQSKEELIDNMLVIKHAAGHYQALVPGGQAARPGLEELQCCLDEFQVGYVVTEG